MSRMAEMFQNVLALLTALDPVDSWLYRICQSHGVDCTITWRRLITAFSALLVATIVYVIVSIRRARWEVKGLPGFVRWRAFLWVVMHHTILA